MYNLVIKPVKRSFNQDKRADQVYLWIYNFKNKADNIEEQSQDEGYYNENQVEEEEQKPEPTEAETPGQTSKPGAGESPVTRNSQMGEYGEEGTRKGNDKSTEWDSLSDTSREGNSQLNAFENRKSPEENLESNNIPTRQSPVGESEVKVEGDDNLNKKVDEISSAEDEILDKLCERESHEEQREDESLEESGNGKQDSDGEGEGKDYKSTKGDNKNNPKEEQKGVRLGSDAESQQGLNPGFSQLRGFRGTAPDGLSLLKPHQSDNLSAITEENSNLGDESTNKSFTEDEKDAEEDADDNDNEGKETPWARVTFPRLPAVPFSFALLVYIVCLPQFKYHVLHNNSFSCLSFQDKKEKYTL